MLAKASTMFFRDNEVIEAMDAFFRRDRVSAAKGPNVLALPNHALRLGRAETASPAKDLRCAGARARRQNRLHSSTPALLLRDSHYTGKDYAAAISELRRRLLRSLPHRLCGARMSDAPQSCE